MEKTFSVLIIFFMSLMFLPRIHAKGLDFSKEELMRRADIVITGEVIKMEKTGTTQKIFLDYEGEVNFAVIKINKVLKGDFNQGTLAVDFVKLIEGLEADVQGPQFAVGSKGTAYLEKLPNGHFKALGGWFEGWTLE